LLQDRGFIVEVTKGAFSRKIRHATEWRLTEFSCDLTDALPTRDYSRWPQKIQNTVPVARLYGPRSGTIRYPQRDNEPRESVQKPLLGTCSGTIEGPDGTCSGTRLVCQSVAPAIGEQGAGAEGAKGELGSDGLRPTLLKEAA
jgi:hypothetical protein